MSIFKGSATAMVTPFKNGEVDYEALENLLDFQMENNTDALVMCGTTGEASTMTLDEKVSVVRFTKEHIKGAVPIIVGTGSNNTAQTVQTSRSISQIGIDALLVVTPYYNKTSQAGLIAHYNAVAEASELPIIVYNVPGRTGVNVLPSTMKKLMENPRIVAIKEASGNIEQIVTLAATCPDCDIYSGNDDHVLPVLALGGCGVISTVSNIIPKQMHELCEAYFLGNIVRARQIQFEMLPMCRAAFVEVNPIPIKTMLAMAGYCTGELRLPLVPALDSSMPIIRDALRGFTPKNPD